MPQNNIVNTLLLTSMYHKHSGWRKRNNIIVKINISNKFKLIYKEEKKLHRKKQLKLRKSMKVTGFKK